MQAIRVTVGLLNARSQRVFSTAAPATGTAKEGKKIFVDPIGRTLFDCRVRTVRLKPRMERFSDTLLSKFDLTVMNNPNFIAACNELAAVIEHQLRPCPELHSHQDAMLALDERAPPSDATTSRFSDEWNTWNPLLELMWKPLMADIRAGAPDSYQNKTFLQATSLLFSHAVPCATALRTIRDLSPGGRVMELGAGTGYWATLLHTLGADVAACDTGGELQTTGIWFPALQRLRASEFVRAHGATRSLFVCYPRITDEQPPPGVPAEFVAAAGGGENAADAADLADALRYYEDTRAQDGGVVFVVGERPGESTDSVAQRLMHRGWHIKRAVPLPRLPGSHTVLLALQHGLPPEQRDGSPLGVEMARVFSAPAMSSLPSSDRSHQLHSGIHDYMKQLCQEWRAATAAGDAAGCRRAEAAVDNIFKGVVR